MFAASLVQLQWAERLLAAASGDRSDLIRDLRDQQPWFMDCEDTSLPERLLLQIEGSIRIRKGQQEMAKQMQDPPNGKNTVMQSNMGAGKSSVIIPMVASSLADGSSLVRVIVPRPQYKQMLDTLICKLGGLIGRRVYQLPFSRSLKLRNEEFEVIYKLCQECAANGGVLLVQPEHLLSLQLMILDLAINNAFENKLASSISSIWHFCHTNARDIVDECDDVFSPKSELIYTIGEQRSIEFSPDRWLIVQELLKLVQQFIPQVKEEAPGALVVDSLGAGRFPHIRFTEKGAWERLSEKICRHICDEGLPGLPTKYPDLHGAMMRYISKLEVQRHDIHQIQQHKLLNPTTSSILLLIRGMLAYGVLQYSLEKRYRANYGLDISRTPATLLAVPYRGKDCPAPRSEYSHQDMVIVLTCLSYYYGGLSEENFSIAVNRLLQLDQATIEYQLWVKSAPTLPRAYHQLDGVNWDDPEIRSEVTSHLRYSKATIDFFLNNVVFLKEMREFPNKLSSSGWDIARPKVHPLAGFSGTNDMRWVIPQTVSHLDIESQIHIDALNLERLLQSENTVCQLTTLGISGVPRAIEIIQAVAGMNQDTRVLIDPGAQIVEMTNEEVARTWLGCVENQNVQAAVYCNGSHELMVVDRSGHKDLLCNSPYATQLDACLVFLDDVHTRGTDLRLPRSCRAAVTLGANLTKDRMTQGELKRCLHQS